MLIWVIFIISVVVSSIIVNKAQQLFMDFMGADGMFFSVKAKLIAILVLALILASVFCGVFGIEIPKT